MRRLLLAAATVWVLARVGIPMLESWEMGSIDTIGHSQLEGSR
jgi:hypothetical protein